MSLLADLLSKIKPRTYQEGDVPPGLKRAVSDSSHKEMLRRRIIILSSLLILAIVAGVVTVYVMDMFLNKPSVRKQAGRHEQAAQVVKSEIKAEAEKAQEPAQKSEPAVSQKAAAQPTPKPKKGVQKKPAPEKRIAKATTPLSSTSRIRAVGPEDSQKAATDTHEAPAVNDSQRDMYIYTARTFESRKDYSQALFNYKKALESDPNNYIIMSNISSALLYLESYEEAIRYAMNALNIKKDYVPSLINLGIASIRLNNLSEGESYLLKALSIEPANRHVLFNIGLLLEKRGDNDKANEYFLRLSEKDDINGFLGAARIAEKQGRASDAVRIYKEIFSMNNVSLDIRKLANDRLVQLQPTRN